MNQRKFLTQEGYDSLKEKLEQLRKFDKIEVASQIKEARELGTLEENATYDAALERQGMIESKIQEIESILANCKIIEQNKSDFGTVTLGSTVVVSMDGKIDTFTLVTSAEADPLKKYLSDESPVGKALIGAKIGESVEIQTPVFSVVCKILEIK